MIPFLGCHFVWGQLGIFKDVLWHIFKCDSERYLIGVRVFVRYLVKVLLCLLLNDVWSQHFRQLLVLEAAPEELLFSQVTVTILVHPTARKHCQQVRSRSQQ